MSVRLDSLSNNWTDSASSHNTTQHTSLVLWAEHWLTAMAATVTATASGSDSGSALSQPQSSCTPRTRPISYGSASMDRAGQGRAGQASFYWTCEHSLPCPCPYPRETGQNLVPVPDPWQNERTETGTGTGTVTG
jgi:hypothetical protein